MLPLFLEFIIKRRNEHPDGGARMAEPGRVPTGPEDSAACAVLLSGQRTHLPMWKPAICHFRVFTEAPWYGHDWLNHCPLLTSGISSALWPPQRLEQGGAESSCFWSKFGLVGKEPILKAPSTFVLCLVAQSRPTPCDPMDCSPPGSSVHGCCRQEHSSGTLLQGIFFPNPGMNKVSCTTGRFYAHWDTTEAH